MRRFVVGLLCLGFAGAASAQEIKGPYLGVSAGYFGYEDTVSTQNVSEVLLSDNSAIYRLLLGYHLNENYAIEAAWGTAGDFKELLFNNFTGALLDVFAEVELTTLRFLAIAPFNGINVIGGVGYYDADVDFDTLLVMGDTRIEETVRGGADGLTILGGIQFDFDRLSLRGEYEWFDSSGAEDASNISVSLIFRF